MWSSCFVGGRRFHWLPCEFMRFYFSTINRLWNLLRCNFLLCNHFRGASMNHSHARHGWCHVSFQFSPRIFESFFVILVIRINEVISSQSSSIVELLLLVFPFLFLSILSGFTNFGPYFWPYMIWSGSRLNFCQSPPGPHISLGMFFFQSSEFGESISKIWQASVQIDIPIVIDTFLLHDVQISVSRPCYINVFLWNRVCFFLWHIELNSRFIVMTMDEVTLDRPEVGTGLSVICCFWRWRLSRFALKFSSENFAPFGLFPSWSGFSEVVVSSWQFCCTICYWEYEFISFLSWKNCFRVDSSRLNFWCIQLFQIYEIRNQNISFPESHRDQLISKKHPRSYFLAKLMKSW